MKRCLVYIPYKLDEDGKSARMLRPLKMIQAFRDIGYEVVVIDGTSSQRKNAIREVKKRISQGEKFDFMYSESHTSPTLLTDPSHMPTHPFMDFGFFRFIKNQGIKIGLFYPDIYWKFDTYGTHLPTWKKKAAILNYQYDVRQYKKYLNKFYLADLKVCDYLCEEKLTSIASELPPGAENISIDNNYGERDFYRQPLQIFYVGGIGVQYQILELVKAIKNVDHAELVICCRKPEWEKEKANYEPYLCDRISIIHKNSDALEPYYQAADICSLLFKNDIYREMAKPFKAFEYLAHEKPVLATKGTAIGNFVEENDIGWSLAFESDAISKTINDIINNPGVLVQKIENCSHAKKTNLWISRAEKVAKDLT